MSDTQSYYSGLLSTIDTKISGLITNQEVSYSIGNTSVSASDKLAQLMKLREMIITRMIQRPFEVIENVQDGVSVFGEDFGRYYNEANS